MPVDFETLPAQLPAGEALELAFEVLHALPGSQLVLSLRSNIRQPTKVRGWSEDVFGVACPRRFRARLPALAVGETLELVPVIESMGRVLQSLPERTVQAAPPTRPAADAPEPPLGVPRYEWTTEFLGAFTVQLVNPPESFGPGPGGMPITYLIKSGDIRGPRLNGRVHGGDWMMLRPDGVGMAESRISYETDDGARIQSRYYGILDLGPDGYARAKRNEFDPMPPLVLAPRFFTSHPRWLWLNRLQCIAVGRAMMAELLVRLDIYAVRAGQPLPSSGLPPVAAASSFVNDVR